MRTSCKRLHVKVETFPCEGSCQPDVSLRFQTGRRAWAVVFAFAAQCEQPRTILRVTKVSRHPPDPQLRRLLGAQAAPVTCLLDTLLKPCAIANHRPAFQRICVVSPHATARSAHWFSEPFLTKSRGLMSRRGAAGCQTNARLMNAISTAKFDLRQSTTDCKLAFKGGA